MRPTRDGQAPPVRIVHLGLGNFFRAHQAWYTDTAPDAADWGIAAFTGRSRTLSDAMSAQDGLYTLVERGPEHDGFRVVGSVAAAYPGTDEAAWTEHLARPEVAVVTLTVTEAAYRTTVAQRLVAGLAARRAAGSGPVAVMSCDNLPDNGAVTRRAVLSAADPELAEWIGATVSFVTTMVDRITPATTDDDLRTVARHTGYHDAAPVVTEPFTEWVIQGDFPAGRPRWEAAGARFVTDVVPHERRKLWLLNGGHSLLAYAGSARGHETIAQAVADPACRAWLEQWWDEAAAHLPLPAAEITAYRAALLARWANPRIQHRLAQIAADGSQKLPARVLPVLRESRSPGAARIVAAWIAHLRGAGAPVTDTTAGTVVPAAARGTGAVLALLGLDADLAGVVDAAGRDLAAR